MRIVQLETTFVRALTDAAWSFNPEHVGPGGVTVVTGPPQAGLTTFLDAIAFTAARLAFGGPSPDTADVLRFGAPTALIRTTWWLDAEERAFGGVADETVGADVVFARDGLGRVDADPALLGIMSRYDHTDEHAKVLSLPARRVADGGMPMLNDFESDQKFMRLSPDVGKFAGISNALLKHATGYGERARFEAVQRLFGELTGSARLAGVTKLGQMEFTVGSGARLPLNRLSFSERNAFVLAAMPVLLGLGRSVILLDTPEVGLAPGVAARWLDVLRGATPDAQWIVASRDPAVVESVPPAARITLTQSTPEAP